MKRNLCLGALGLALLALTPAVAADSGRGRAFVQANCSRCHDIGRGVSPLPRAPNFATLARRYRSSDLEEAFAEGIVTGHRDMPEFVLTPRQIDDLMAYMRRLGGR
jgi:cytochrome c